MLSLRDNISKWFKKKSDKNHTEAADDRKSGQAAPPNNLPASVSPKSASTFTISPEIAELVWIGDGPAKNYAPPARKAAPPGTVVVFTGKTDEEPSALYLSLPVSKPAPGELVERPPYWPVYKELTPEQRWLYWEFLSSPFSPQNNIGYVFLFYYGLERHMVSGQLDKAFDITLRLRECYNNSSFQFYTAQALITICIAKQRADLALKLTASDSRSRVSSLPMKYLLSLKYTFRLPLTVQEIIGNYQYFGFSNNRYIKNQPELFLQALSELMQNRFQSDAVDLSHFFYVDMDALPLEHERMFSNSSLGSYETPVPIFENQELGQAICGLLLEAHETVKARLKELRRQGTSLPNPRPVPKAKPSPIEAEGIPQKLVFDLSEMENWNTWPNQRIFETFDRLSAEICKSGEVLPRIEACEKSYLILKPVMDIFFADPAGPPSVIPCCGYGPYLYRLIGNFDDAERAIRLCMDAGAYESPDEGKAELEHLLAYRKVAEAAIDFIQKNPGFLQKNIYIALTAQIGEDNIPTLKEFMRETYVFHKQPCKGSYQLHYIVRK